MLVTLRANLTWVSSKSTSDALTLFVHTQLAPWAFDGAVAACRIDTRVRGDIKVNAVDRELGIFHVNTKPFTFHGSPPCLDHYSGEFVIGNWS